MKIWSREENQFIEEKEYGKTKLEFLYNTYIGRILLKIIFASRWFSKINGIYQRSALSRKKIEKFVKEYDINMSSYQDINKYKTFEEFFRRKRDITTDLNKEAYIKNNLISIADAKLKVVNLTKNSTFVIKHSIYDLKDLILDEKLSEEFKDGICLIYRLTVDDYHRYIFLDNGNVEKQYYIKGKLHTVQPISDKYKVYIRNSRNVSVLNTDNFGKILQIEVGAMLVGKINNKNAKEFLRFDEKGFFDYGGSTIIQVIKNNNVKIDDKILKMSNEDIEVKVKIGDVIGKYMHINYLLDIK